MMFFCSEVTGFCNNACTMKVVMYVILMYNFAIKNEVFFFFYYKYSLDEACWELHSIIR